jgi:hypothetical protein
VQQAVCLLVADKSLIDRIPPERSFQAHGDVGLMTHRIGPHCDINRAERIFSRLYGVQKIPAVITAVWQPDIVRTEGCF